MEDKKEMGQELREELALIHKMIMQAESIEDGEFVECLTIARNNILQGAMILKLHMVTGGPEE